MWNLKAEGISAPDVSLDKHQDVFNQCLRNILIFLMHTQKVPIEYFNCLENGIANLNGTIEECSVVLSLKPESQSQNAEHLHSMQSTFLCLVYNSYLFDGPIMNVKSIIPHVVYYITCNFDTLCSNILNLKHIVFILAVCIYENMNKVQTGLIEVSGMMWDILSKMNSPAEVYTHHKVVLWWCFRHQQVNLFSSFVMQVWLEYSLHATDTFLSLQATKMLVNLLTTNDIAQETFVRQFKSKTEIRFNFLEKAFETEISNSEDLIMRERFEKLIQSCIPQLQNWLSKMLIMKNHEDLCKDSSLSVGLKCLLWCQEKITSTYSQVDIKLVFHVTSFCCNSSFDVKLSLIACLKYLQYAVKVESKDSKAWHIVTGNANIISFLRKSLALRGEFETEILHLLILILEHQTHAGLTCNASMTIPFAQILKWMNCKSTKIASLELVNNLLTTEFKGLFIKICSLEESMPSHEPTLSRNDIRILVIYLQNAIMLGNPVIDKVALPSYKKLLKYIAETDPHLDRHIMLQPWLRILLESQLEDLPNSRELFENWCNFDKENVTLTGVMDQYANRILDNPDIEIQDKAKLNLGVYRKSLHRETISKMKEIAASNSSCDDTQEVDLILDIENFVANTIANISNAKK